MVHRRVGASSLTLCLSRIRPPRRIRSAPSDRPSPTAASAGGAGKGDSTKWLTSAGPCKLHRSRAHRSARRFGLRSVPEGALPLARHGLFERHLGLASLRRARHPARWADTLHLFPGSSGGSIRSRRVRTGGYASACATLGSGRPSFGSLGACPASATSPPRRS